MTLSPQSASVTWSEFSVYSWSANISECIEDLLVELNTGDEYYQDIEKLPVPGLWIWMPKRL